MNARQADALGARLVELIESGRIAEACGLLTPSLNQRIPFATLDRIGITIGNSSSLAVNTFLEGLAAEKVLGAWPTP